MGRFDSIVPSLAYILTKQHGVCGVKHLLKTTFNAIFETLNFKMSLDALAPKTCFSHASAKSTRYSLSVCYLTALQDEWAFA